MTCVGQAPVQLTPSQEKVGLALHQDQHDASAGTFAGDQPCRMNLFRLKDAYSELSLDSSTACPKGWDNSNFIDLGASLAIPS